MMLIITANEKHSINKGGIATLIKNAYLIDVIYERHSEEIKILTQLTESE